MAENINSTQPVAPALPIKPALNDQQDKAKDKKRKNNKHSDNDNQDPVERPHHGLFDEYV